MNCCGTPLLGFNSGKGARTHIPPERRGLLRIATSVPGPTKDESPNDQSWWLAAALPFKLLDQFPSAPPPAKAGDVWRANFYRCGGKTDQQYACWSPIDPAKQSEPSFHDPEFFGELVFG
jgi:hypothetical protein